MSSNSGEHINISMMGVSIDFTLMMVLDVTLGGIPWAMSQSPKDLGECSGGVNCRNMS